MHVEQKIEILGHKLNGVWYEIHVDATKQRVIIDVFSENGEVTGKIWNELQKEVDKIEII